MISLINNGLLELDLIKTMGVNVKENESSIGYFGTGLKYAIAVFLREDIDFQLFIGENCFEFYKEIKSFRNKEFEVCCMRGPSDHIELNFTTDLGKNWSLWQAYREVHSNCLDEMGSIYTGSTHPLPKKDHTLFRFRNLDEYIDVSSIFLNFKLDRELVYKNEEIEIYNEPSDCIFYKGIRAKELVNNSKYTYNVIKECVLTEDRLLCYDFEVKEAINKAVVEMASENREVMINIVSSEYGYFESSLGMDYNTQIKPNEEFSNYVTQNKETVNPSVLAYVKKHETPKPISNVQKKELFIEEIKELCELNGVCFYMHNMGDSPIIELSDGILEAKDEEDS